MLDIGTRPDQHLAVVAVNDHDVAIVDPLGRLGDAADHRDIESPRDDRDMRRRRAFFQHQRLDPPAGVIQQLGRPHRVRDEDELGRRVRRHHAG